MAAPFTVLVQVRGGVVVDVSSTDPDHIDVIVFDWDDADGDPQYLDAETCRTLREIADTVPEAQAVLDEYNNDIDLIDEYTDDDTETEG